MPPLGEMTVPSPVAGDVDVALQLASYPRDQMLKGMFLSKLARELGPDWRGIQQTPVSPPPLGGYVPFADYPLVDHAALALAVAKKREPNVTTREAVRRLARNDIRTFLESTIGRVTAAAVSTPEEALLALPEVYKLVATGPRYEAKKVGPKHVRLSLINGYGLWEYQVGQLEGIAGHYGADTRIRCSLDGDVRCFDVGW